MLENNTISLVLNFMDGLSRYIEYKKNARNLKIENINFMRSLLNTKKLGLLLRKMKTAYRNLIRRFRIEEKKVVQNEKNAEKDIVAMIIMIIMIVVKIIIMIITIVVKIISILVIII